MGRSLGLASAVYAFSILLSRVIGLVREAVIGRTLGNGPEADVYFTAFVLPDFLNYLLAGGALSLVFIPIFQGYLVRSDEAGAWRAFSNIGNALLILVLGGTAALMWLAPSLSESIAPGLDASRQAQLVGLIRLLLPAQIFHVMGGLLSATLQARDQHTMPALAPLVYTLGVIGGGVLLGPWLGPEGFAWGVLVGSVLGPFGLPLWGAWRAGLRWHGGLGLNGPDVRIYFQRSLPVMLGFSVVVFDDFILRRQGSLLEAGTVSRLTYAKTLMRVPMGVFGLAAGMAAFPSMARLFAEGRKPEGYALVVRAVRLTLVLALAAQAGLTAAGTEVATVVWGDRRFTADELAEVGRFTAWVCLGLWGWSVQGLIARGFYALGDTLTPTVVGSVVTLLLFPLYVVLGETWGGDGLAVASSVAISANVLALSWALRRRVALDTPPTAPGMVDALLRLAPAVALGVGLASVVAPYLPPALPALVRGSLLGGLSTLTCLACAALLGVGEVGEVARGLRHRLRRRRGA